MNLYGGAHVGPIAPDAMTPEEVIASDLREHLSRAFCGKRTDAPTAEAVKERMTEILSSACPGVPLPFEMRARAEGDTVTLWPVVVDRRRDAEAAKWWDDHPRSSGEAGHHEVREDGRIVFVAAKPLPFVGLSVSLETPP